MATVARSRLKGKSRRETSLSLGDNTAATKSSPETTHQRFGKSAIPSIAFSYLGKIPAVSLNRLKISSKSSLEEKKHTHTHPPWQRI